MFLKKAEFIIIIIIFYIVLPGVLIIVEGAVIK